MMDVKNVLCSVQLHSGLRPCLNFLRLNAWLCEGAWSLCVSQGDVASSTLAQGRVPTLKPILPFLQQTQASMRKTKVKRPEKEMATTARDEDQVSSLSGAPSAGHRNSDMQTYYTQRGRHVDRGEQIVR